ncbi:efflux RND transporter periplasmic adaptor subunit [Nannocystis radixulma]|uniref:Efflux RND transporter periplasmic adaptor subunit n=1 Tax=Nannocystis radixulma TaxID=2995305 RepID=A0ABT5B9C6_9BACT|nr:efflux RND transporter periplasmic adaptor subunit [Nannocystis radixulma]MDC0670736.1 efflux RND transporter periplasmic adaptor subunit [Nannocystis radixulma]
MPLAPARVVLFAALLGVACTSAPVDAGKAASGPQPRAVEVAEARAAPHPRILTLSSTLAALEKVQVAARVEGPITEVKVDLGDRVTREQELAAIRPIDYRARVSELDASLAQAESDVKRLESLGGVATQEELERARTRLTGAKAQRSQASRQLGDTTVRAPFAGAIAARYVAPGTYVKPGTPLFDLVADDRLRLTVEVPERYAALVQVGTPATITLKDSLVGEPGEAGAKIAEGAGAAQAAITRVSPVVSPTTRTFTVEAVFSPAGSVLRPGMFTVASLSLGQEAGSVRVPRPAVFHVLGRDRVMRVEDGVAVAHDVELIAEENGDAIVLGLDPGSQVIVRGAALIAPGTPVAPTAAKDMPVGTGSEGQGAKDMPAGAGGNGAETKAAAAPAGPVDKKMSEKPGKSEGKAP